MRLATATILILALAGCAETSSTLHARQQVRETQVLQAHYDSDLSAPSFAILAGKVDLRQLYRPGVDPCASVREDRLPTAEESVALRRWAEMWDSHVASLEAIVMSETTGSSQVLRQVDQFNAAVDNGLRAESELISDLADGRLTYCQFARLDKAQTETTLRQAEELRHNIREARQFDYDLSHRYSYANPNGGP